MERKIVILGDKNIGKRSLVRNFLTKNPNPVKATTDPIENYKYQMQIHGYNILLSIWIMPEDIEHAQLRQIYYHNPQADVFILCYAASNETSFDNLKKFWYTEVSNHIGTSQVILASINDVANKKKEDCVPRSAAVNLMKEFKMANFFECSTKKSLGVDEMFKFAATAKNISAKNSRSNRSQKCSNCVLL